jgi:hypothetical protein
MSEAPKISNLPNVAKARLGSAVPIGSHPDADQLTAFVEQRLAAQERELVLTHLSACIDCREIVALAATEEPLVSANVVLGEKKSFRWNFMKWGVGVATAAVIVTAVVVLQPQKSVAPQNEVSTYYGSSEKPAEQSKTAPPTKDSDTPSTAQPANASSDKAAASENAYNALSNSKEAKNTAKPQEKERKPEYAAIIAPQGRAVIPSTSAGSGAAADYIGNVASNSPAPASPPPPPPAQPEADRQKQLSKDSVEVAAQNEAVRTESEKSAYDRYELRDTATLSQAAKTKSASAPSAAAAPQKKLEAVQGTRARNDQFAIDGVDNSEVKTGVIQKSRFFARIHDGKLEVDQNGRWIASSLSASFAPSAELSTYAAFGDTVWVGGKGGELYVSSDNGKTWKTIKGEWKGEITSITRRDATHGEIKTSTGETWSTDDAGSSWKKK